MSVLVHVTAWKTIGISSGPKHNSFSTGQPLVHGMGDLNLIRGYKRLDMVEPYKSVELSIGWCMFMSWLSWDGDQFIMQLMCLDVLDELDELDEQWSLLKIKSPAILVWYWTYCVTVPRNPVGRSWQRSSHLHRGAIGPCGYRSCLQIFASRSLFCLGMCVVFVDNIYF